VSEPESAEARGAGPDSTLGSAVRTVFFGSGGFAVPILDALVGMPEIRLVSVVSAPDRPVGRKAVLTPTPVAARAAELGLPLHQPARVRTPDSVAALATLRPDLAVLADYGQLIPRSLIELPPRGFLNVHPSALPRHRGATPIPATILAGDAVSAVTLLCLVEALDAGPIVAIAPLPVEPGDTTPELEERASATGARLVAEALPRWLAGTLVPAPQDEAAATLTKPLRREDGRLDASRPAEALERQVRAYQPWPGSFVELPEGRLIVWRAAVTGESTPGAVPGDLVRVGPAGIAFVTGRGLLVLDEVQPAGKRRMSGAEFRRGRPDLAAAPARNG
jgi:methionyl-tRNA formyltransferase